MTALRERREAVVREHMESENEHDFDTTLATFGHPRYEIIPTGDVHDGAEAVMAYFTESRTAFPDQRNELIAMHHPRELLAASASKGSELWIATGCQHAWAFNHHAAEYQTRLLAFLDSQIAPGSD